MIEHDGWTRNDFMKWHTTTKKTQSFLSCTITICCLSLRVVFFAMCAFLWSWTFSIAITYTLAQLAFLVTRNYFFCFGFSNLFTCHVVFSVQDHFIVIIINNKWQQRVQKNTFLLSFNGGSYIKPCRYNFFLIYDHAIIYCYYYCLSYLLYLVPPCRKKRYPRWRWRWRWANTKTNWNCHILCDSDGIVTYLHGFITAYNTNCPCLLYNFHFRCSFHARHSSSLSGPYKDDWTNQRTERTEPVVEKDGLYKFFCLYLSFFHLTVCFKNVSLILSFVYVRCTKMSVQVPFSEKKRDIPRLHAKRITESTKLYYLLFDALQGKWWSFLYKFTRNTCHKEIKKALSDHHQKIFYAWTYVFECRCGHSFLIYYLGIMLIILIWDQPGSCTYLRDPLFIVVANSQCPKAKQKIAVLFVGIPVIPKFLVGKREKKKVFLWCFY